MNGTKLVDGAIAGAVGSTALNMVSYLDMVLRARPASGTPEDSAGRVAELALGPLLGYGMGIAAGTAFALLAGRRRTPLPAAVALLGGSVMAMSDGSMAALGVTDPRRWSRIDWLSDLVPHLAYGMAAAATWNRLRPPSSRRR